VTLRIGREYLGPEVTLPGHCPSVGWDENPIYLLKICGHDLQQRITNGSKEEKC
jgi:hypothetical protein